MTPPVETRAPLEARVGALETRAAVLEHADSTKEAMLRAGSQSMGEARAQQQATTTDLTMTKAIVQSHEIRLSAVEGATKPTPWWQKPGLVAVLLAGLSLAVPMLRNPDRADLEKGMAGVMVHVFALQKELSESRAELARVVERGTAASARADALQAQLDELKAEARKRR